MILYLASISLLPHACPSIVNWSCSKKVDSLMWRVLENLVLYHIPEENEGLVLERGLQMGQLWLKLLISEKNCGAQFSNSLELYWNITQYRNNRNMTEVCFHLMNWNDGLPLPFNSNLLIPLPLPSLHHFLLITTQCDHRKPLPTCCWSCECPWPTPPSSATAHPKCPWTVSLRLTHFAKPPNTREITSPHSWSLLEDGHCPTTDPLPMR